jgi:hypothetical protein
MLDLDEDRYFGEELILIQSRRLIQRSSMVAAASGGLCEGGTIRFEIPKAKTDMDRRHEVDEALQRWLDSGQMTMRRVIKMSREEEQAPSKSTAALRQRAQIEMRVAAWSDSQQSQIEEEVRKWISKDAASPRRPLSARTDGSRKVDPAKAALRRPTSARGTSSEVVSKK